MFRVYCGLARTQAEYAALKPGWMARAYEDRDDALGWALRVLDLGVEVPWEIEGDDGTRLSRDQIEALVRARRHDLADRPKVY
jgi:hypothetical protein